MKKGYTILLSGLVWACSPQAEKPHRLDAWADEIVYFALTDRFADGDTAINDLGDGAYDPTKPGHFQGGDFEGISQNINYLKALGITTLWITPPVKNQVWSPDSSLTGYHGYWASHFAETDPHLGSLQAYKKLSRDLQKKGIRLIQDVVTNHTGDYFNYTGPWDAQTPWRHFEKAGAPAQWPFSQNDVRKQADRAAAIYHFTPSISNYQDSLEKLTGQMSGLDDLNTSNPTVLNALKASFRFWMKEVQVDGIRFDTPMYVEHPFWNRFLHDSSRTNPGLYTFAQQMQQPNFYTFGETWVHSQPFENTGEKTAASYLGSREAPEMDGILNFPMQQSIQRVFGGGAPTSELSYRLAQEQVFFPQPWQKLHFIDNHDMPRFRSLTSAAATQQALAFILTIPGVPVLYYGTEQGFTETRANLFGKRDTSSADFAFVQALIQLRKAHPAFSRGQLQMLADDSLQMGLLLYALRYKNDVKYVALNTKDVAISCGPITLPQGTGQLVPLFKQGKVVAGEVSAGVLPYLQLAARSILVFELSAGSSARATQRPTLSMHPLPVAPITQSEQTLSGTYAGIDSLVGWVDGLAPLAMTLEMENGQFTASLVTAAIPQGKHHVQWMGYQNKSLVLMERYAFETALPKQKLLEIKDPGRDDLGPHGSYSYPTGFGKLRSMDMAALTVYAQGSALTFELSMQDAFSTQWNPPLGFDHVQFFLFLNVNRAEGTRFYPPLRYKSDGEAGFTHFITVNGWQMSVQQVDAQGQLVAVAGAPTFKLLSDRKLSLHLSPELLGFPAELEKLQFCFLTWDSAGEGELRTLQTEAGEYHFGGPVNNSCALWMDQLSGSWERVAP